MEATQTIEIEETGGKFVATVPTIGATVTGATLDEALANAEQAIVARMIEEAEKRKRRRRGKDHTVA
ncbi:MAG TPA: hypothetical protein VEL69_06265 [Ktedonobacteraceae bacterium]|nr:hypothetical protein [Ktedonobacteraceae bacterium]